MTRRSTRASAARRASAAALLVLGVALAAQAEPLAPADVPEPLRPWIAWVLWDAPDARCPRGFASDTQQCRWISRIELALDDAGGSFRQNVSLFRDDWVPLPGGAERWPEQVEVDGRPGAVLAHDGAPSLRLPAGRYRVTGRFRWSALPELLAIPAETALVALELRGTPVPFPERQSPERLWLARERPEAREESRLDVSVHRMLSDDVPLGLVTNIELRVAGAPREVVWNGVLPEGFAPMALDAALPARLGADGSLRVQVRPGTYGISLRARGTRRDAPLRAPQVGGPWDADEVWVFQARPELRTVDVEGPPSIDPQQTQLPGDWRSLPAYLLTPGTELRLVERTRGDAVPASDRLRLARTLWLDFDGGGYSLREVLSGALARSWRLEMRPPIRLGRVAIDDVDQPITRLDPEGADGVELRRGALALTADARLDAAGSTLPTVGWSGDVEAASAQLRLPPGWTALHVSGADRVNGTWLDSWSLLQLFLVLIGALAIGRLFGWGFGALALAGFALIFPEPDAPRYVWLLALAAQALARVAPPGRMQRGVQGLRIAAILALALVALPFAAQQARQALHPSLERVEPYFGTLGGYTGYTMTESLAESDLPAAAPPESPVPDEPGKPDVRQRSFPKPSRISIPQLNYVKPDPNAVVSTGPGIPSWIWRRVELEWTGPVTAEEELRPWLLPPWANRLLSALRVALCAALALVVLGRGGDLRRLGQRLRPGAAAAGVVALCALGPGLARAEIPSAEQLAELRKRLLAPPACAPQCATSARLELEVEPAQLRARLSLDVGWPSAVPLPGGLGGFTPQAVLVDDQPATALKREPDGVLYVQLERGRHDVRIVGALADVESLVLPLPLRPRRVQVSARGWTVSGLRPDGVATDSLQLTRERQSAEPAARGTSELPPFLRVERTLLLGLNWQIETRIQRLTPAGRPIVASIPLLEGEAVTAEGVEVSGGRAQFTLGAGADELAWTSILAAGERIELRSEASELASERWRLDAAPFWHVEVSGIPAVASAPAAQRVREWQPWPGEQVGLTLTRPGPAPGQSATIDRSELRIAPGARYAGASLSFGVRASRGMRQTLTLPGAAELEEVAIDGQRQSLRLVDGKLELGLRPGAQEVLVRWRAPGSLGTAYATPQVDLGLPSVNATLLLDVPRDRWILWTSGPPLGPAVLFWGLFAVTALLALGLGRIPLTPLRATSWFLLFVGLTQVHIAGGALVVLWLLALGARGRGGPERRWLFNGMQLGLALLTLVALAALALVIQQGLLGPPEMQIAGNDSSGSLLSWYQDRASEIPETGHVLWVPAWLYRVAMLGWALWLAVALVDWLRWGWGCFCHQGVWRGRPASAREAG